MNRDRVCHSIRTVGKISAGVALGSAVWAFFSASPWSPTRQKDLERLKRVLNAQPGERIFELGCGDGRVSCALAADCRAHVTGVELSLPLVFAAKLRVLKRGLGRGVKILWRNFYHADLRQADAVYLYLTPRTLFRLGSALAEKLPPHARVVSYQYPIPGFHPVRVDQPAATDAPIFEYRMRPNARQVAFAI